VLDFMEFGLEINADKQNILSCLDIRMQEELTE